jgi:hypothetical protein
MNVTNAIQVVGKVVEYEDGSKMLLVSPGFDHMGEGATLVMRKESPEAAWVEMPMREALPYVMELARQILGTGRS